MDAIEPNIKPAAGFAKDFLKLVKAASPGRIVDFVAATFTKENGDRFPQDKRIASFMDWSARGGFEVTEVLVDTPQHYEALVRLRLSDEPFRMAIEMDGYKCSALRLGRVAFPIIEEPDPDQDVADAIVGYAGALADADVFSGAILVARHGEILATGAFGLANQDFKIPNSVETRFNVASLTKSWTAVAICQLVEDGKIDLRDKVERFLTYPDPDAAAKIEIRHLLSHTAGLGDYFVPEFEEQPRQKLRSCKDYLELCHRYKPEFEPGTKWRYSNVGMVLLGRILEIVTEQDYFEYVTEAVLERADMKGAGFPALDRVNPGAATGYHRIWSANGSIMTTSLFEGQVRATPAGCGYATLKDIFLFSEAFRTGQLVSHEMVQLMSAPKQELNAPDYGYGFAVHPERALFGHSGGLIGASANLDIMCEPEGWTIVVLCNDLSMRAPVLKARQLVGVRVPEAEEARAWLPNSGLSAR